MIVVSDKQVCADIVAEWTAVREQQGRLQIHLVASTNMGGWVMSQVQDDIYALLLPFAYSVLEHVLEQARVEGRLSSRNRSVGFLMEAAKDALPWRDFDAVNLGRDARNDFAHRRMIPRTSTTFQALNAIESELIGWGLLTGPVHSEPVLRVG